MIALGLFLTIAGGIITGALIGSAICVFVEWRISVHRRRSMERLRRELGQPAPKTDGAKTVLMPCLYCDGEGTLQSRRGPVLCIACDGKKIVPTQMQTGDPADSKNQTHA